MNDEKLYFKAKTDLMGALAKQGVNFYTCRQSGLFSQGTLTHIKNGENISLNTASKVAWILGCQLTDIFEVVSDPYFPESHT